MNHKIASYMKRVVLFILFLTMSGSGLAQTSERELITELKKFGNFLGYLNQLYVDTLNNKALVEDAIRGVLSQLDPHSSYVPASEMKQIEEEFRGNF